ncbi:hypothetical protein pb186bvf_009682 [Paramecium bursaria]
MQQIKQICTHSGNFHADEVLACVMLKYYTNIFKGGNIVRSRDPAVWAQSHILVDVGGEYSPDNHRYDHHQREFKTTFSNDYEVKLSSAGLIYKHFGKEVIQNACELLKQLIKLKQDIVRIYKFLSVQPPLDEKGLELIYQKIYRNYILAIDAIDNGVNQFNEKPIYQINTNLSQVIGRFNPSWMEEVDENIKFNEAMDYVNREFLEWLKSMYINWYPARKYIEIAVKDRFSVIPTGEIIVLKQFCPWKSHLYDLEKELNIQGQIKFVLFSDKSQDWRIQDAGFDNEGFDLRRGLKSEWRGIKDIPKLIEVSGITDIVFVHASGFIGGAQSYESALKMAIQSLQ